MKSLLGDGYGAKTGNGDSGITDRFVFCFSECAGSFIRFKRHVRRGTECF